MLLAKQQESFQVNLYNELSNFFLPTLNLTSSKGFEMLAKVSKLKIQNPLFFFVSFLDPLTIFVTESLDVPDYIFDSLLSAIISVFCLFPYEEVLQKIDTILAICIQYQSKRDITISSISALRLSFSGLEKYHQYVFENYIFPILNQPNGEEQNIMAILDFYRSFSIEDSTINDLILRSCKYLHDPKRQFLTILTNYYDLYSITFLLHSNPP